MADNNLNTSETAELFEKLNRLLNDNGVLMTEEQKKRKQSLEQQYEEIKALEKSIKLGKEEDIVLSKKLLAEKQYKLQLDITTKAQEKNADALRNHTLRANEELAAIKQRTQSERKEIAEKEGQVGRARAVEEYKNKIAKMSADKTGTLLKGMTEFGSFANKTFLDSTKGQSKYGDAMSGLGDTVINVTSKMGPLGKVAGLAVGGLFKLVGMGLKHNEEMNKAYENLSEFGQVDVGGIPQLFENLQHAGFVMKDMDKFQGVMKGASQDLAYLGNSAADGQKAMTDLYGKTLNTQAEKTLKNLGYTNEQALKTYINYSSNLARLGLMQGKTQDQVSKESLKYATTLDELTKLTGVQRDELQERQRRAEQDIKYRIAMRNAAPEMQEQIRMMAQLTAGGGEEFAAGVREMIANGGNAVTETGIKLQLNTQGAASKIIKAFNRGEIDYYEASRRLAQSMDKRDKSMEKAIVLGGDVAGSFGQTAETMDFTNLMLSKSADAEKEIREKMAAQASGSLDDQRRAETQRQISERNSEQAKDKLAQIVGKGISPTMERLEIVAEALGKTFAKILKMLPFGPDLTEAFQTRDEKLKAKEEDLKKLEKDVNKAKLRHDDKKADELTAQYEKIQAEIASLKGEDAAAGSPEAASKKDVKPFEGTTKEFYNKMYTTLLEQAKKQGVANPEAIARLGAAQSSLETGYGKSTAGGNNYFGIKAKPGDSNASTVATQEWDPKQRKMVTVNAGFRKYNSMDESAADYIKFLKENKRYKDVLAAKTTEEAIAAQNRTGYATDPMYGKKLSEVNARAHKASSGGLFVGPAGGYPVILHGKEVVVPMPDGTGAMSEVQKTPLDRSRSILDQAKNFRDGNSENSTTTGKPVFDMMGQKLDSMITLLRTSSTPAGTSPATSDSKVLIDTLNNKLDSVIDQLRRAANTQEELLQHSRN